MPTQLVALSAMDKIGTLERLDREIALKEARRNRAIAELKRYQENKKLQSRIGQPIVDGEFQEVRKA